jgi:hypothetical protein
MRNCCFVNLEENCNVQRLVRTVISTMMIVCRSIKLISTAKSLGIDGAVKHEGREVEFYLCGNFLVVRR